MVSCRHNDCQDKQRVHDAQNSKEDLPGLGHALLAGSEAAAENARVVHENGADAERVTKVQRGERRQLVEELIGSVYGLGVLVTDRVEEAVLLGQQTRRHARVCCKDAEADNIGKAHHATGGGELGVGRRGIVVPGEEAIER